MRSPAYSEESDSPPSCALILSLSLSFEHILTGGSNKLPTMLKTSYYKNTKLLVIHKYILLFINTFCY